MNVLGMEILSLNVNVFYALNEVNMFKILAMSDIHLNFDINNGVRRKFFNSIRKAKCPIIITGDIGDGRSLESNLKDLSEACNGFPVYFITGNHDYYHSSFERTDEIIHLSVKNFPNLVYLSESSPIRLDEETCLIGVDSWYDAKIIPEGTYLNMLMNDFRYIENLSLIKKSRQEVIKSFQKRASDALKDLKEILSEAVKKYKNIIITSHPLPFGCMEVVKGSDASPFYIWHEAGLFIADFSKNNPRNEFLWLCGHTHSRSEWHNENLNVYCLGSQYYFPRIDGIITDMRFEYETVK
ncbi:MAG: metallophosphoesterase [Candidatus Omnitrophica bacterium]|nr:metallophosphoesterase [Candidatus Omnitrophota bacterium]